MNMLVIRSDEFNDVHYQTGRIILEELKDIFLCFKTGKAPGPDNITTEFRKDIQDESLI
jgi:hypothetical protein